VTLRILTSFNKNTFKSKWNRNALEPMNNRIVLSKLIGLDFGLNSPLLAVDCSFDVMVAVSIRGFLRIDAYGFGLGYSTKSMSTSFSRPFGDYWAH